MPDQLRHVVARDHRAMAASTARALLADLSWKPVEARGAEGILRVVAARGR